MTFALLGLAAIQFRYVKNTLVLKEAQFHYTVDMALSQVGQELQRHEAKQLMQRNQQGRNALERLDSIQHVLSTGWSQDKGYYVKDTVVITEDGALKMSYTTYQDQGPSRLTGGGFADLESDVMVMYNDEWLEEFITGMFDPGLLDPRQQGMEFTELDSIVSSTFAQLGIDSEVQLAVFNSYNEPLLFDNAQGLDPLVALSKADHRMRLPGNVFGIDTEFLHVRFPDKDTFIMSSVWPMLLTSGSLMLIIMGAFGLTIYAILRQKRSSEIKNDFISNMTHELKTPVSTIALACEALEDPDMRSVKGSSDRYIGMIKEENKRLGALVENVLQTAIVDKGELRLKMEGIRLHELIKHSVDTVQLALEKRAGTISLDFQALDDQIDADQTHLQNVIENLIDNALKYSPITPEIRISTWRDSQQLCMVVSDKGIGISKEHQKRIFDTLYRVPTGNTHDVKGFGLGLSYVKAVVESHGGKVSVKSDLGKGTDIRIELPING